MKVGFIIEIVNLPERCDCGGEKGSTVRVAIEAPEYIPKEIKNKRSLEIRAVSNTFLIFAIDFYH